MTMTWFATVAAGVLAMIGLAGILAAVIMKDEGRRSASFKVGAAGMTLGGLVLMLGSIIGWLGASEMYGGLLMIVFGTGSSLVPGKKGAPKAPEEIAR